MAYESYKWYLAKPKRLASPLKPINQAQPAVWIPKFRKGLKSDKNIQRAISIRQPYAEAILRGDKTIEYRSQNTDIRERVYIYASLTKEDSFTFEEYDIDKDSVLCGVIIGSVEIIDSVGEDEDESALGSIF